MKYNINVDDWYSEAVLKKAQGYSNRKIAVMLFDNKNYRNRLNTFFKQESVIEDVKKKEKELEIQGEVNSSYKKPKIEHSQPVICYLDIECSPTKSYTWRRFKENISQAQILSESFFLTASWAFNEGEVEGIRLTPNEALNEDDEALVTKLWHVLNNSTVVVGHNLRRFDIKKINSRFAYYSLLPPSPYKIIDTLEIAKAKFAFPSNKLNDLCEYLGIGEKLPHDGFDLWKRCCNGDEAALIHMLSYNKVDVSITRDLYKRLRNFDNNAVNLAIMSDNVGSLCTTCCSDNISVLENKFAFTPNGKYQVYVCNSCGTKLRATSRIGVSNKLIRVV